MVSSPAYAETITLNCPSSVVEGGLVAQAVNCPSPDLPIGHPYCEYRDLPGTNNALSTVETNGVGSRGREKFSFELLDVDGGVYGYTLENLYIYISGSVYRAGTTTRLEAGRRWGPTFEISGIPNYTKGSSGSARIAITKDGVELTSCDISITDDDNSYYIGQRNQHPYGGTWRTTPHCFTHGCGWQD